MSKQVQKCQGNGEFHKDVRGEDWRRAERTSECFLGRRDKYEQRQKLRINMAWQEEYGDWPDGSRRFILGKSWKLQGRDWKLEESFQAIGFERPDECREDCITYEALQSLFHTLRTLPTVSFLIGKEEVMMMQIWSQVNIRKNGFWCNPHLLKVKH